jgi:hypothetical protein
VATWFTSVSTLDLGSYHQINNLTICVVWQAGLFRRVATPAIFPGAANVPTCRRWAKKGINASAGEMSTLPWIHTHIVERQFPGVAQPTPSGVSAAQPGASHHPGAVAARIPAATGGCMPAGRSGLPGAGVLANIQVRRKVWEK